MLDHNVSNLLILSEIGKCANLESLNVDSNYLHSLPKTIGKLTKLKKLQASNNELKFIPPGSDSILENH